MWKSDHAATRLLRGKLTVPPNSTSLKMAHESRFEPSFMLHPLRSGVWIRSPNKSVSWDSEYSTYNSILNNLSSCTTLLIATCYLLYIIFGCCYSIRTVQPLTCCGPFTCCLGNQFAASLPPGGNTSTQPTRTLRRAVIPSQ